MELRQYVYRTIKRLGNDTSLTDRVVASLINAGCHRKVSTKNEASRVKKHVHTLVQSISSHPSPLKVQASVSTVGICPYCKKPMSRLKIDGDDIQEAFVCIEDRITLPIPSND